MGTPHEVASASETICSTWLPGERPGLEEPALVLYAPNQAELVLTGSGEELYALHERIGAAIRAQHFGRWM